MPSDVFINDFAGDDNVVSSFRQPGSNDSNRNASSSILSVSDFGNLQDNYGWIRCQSRTYPNRVYFYNTNSGCTTWYRPVSRHVDIPFISMSRKVRISSDDVTAVDLELMSVSDNEKEPTTCNKAIEADKNIIARYYYTPRAESASDTDETSAQTSDYSYDRKTEEQTCCASDKNNNNNNNNTDDDSEAKITSLYAANFLETKFFVTEGKVDVESGTLRVFKSPESDDNEDDNDDSSEVSFQSTSNRRSRVVYGVPRLKRINLEHQLIQPTKQSRAVRKKRPQAPPSSPRKSSTACNRAPTKIISNMYGVKTISYDLPGPEQVRAQVGVKFSTLTDSDSDDSEPPPQRAKIARSFESEWRDVGQKLGPLLLSDSSSSPSSRSNRSNSNGRSSDISDCSYFTCSTCSSCSTCN